MLMHSVVFLFFVLIKKCFISFMSNLLYLCTLFLPSFTMLQVDFKVIAAHLVSDLSLVCLQCMNILKRVKCVLVSLPSFFLSKNQRLSAAL